MTFGHCSLQSIAVPYSVCIDVCIDVLTLLQQQSNHRFMTSGCRSLQRIAVASSFCIDVYARCQKPFCDTSKAQERRIIQSQSNPTRRPTVGLIWVVHL